MQWLIKYAGIIVVLVGIVRLALIRFAHTKKNLCYITARHYALLANAALMAEFYVQHKFIRIKFQVRNKLVIFRMHRRGYGERDCDARSISNSCTRNRGVCAWAEYRNLCQTNDISDKYPARCTSLDPIWNEERRGRERECWESLMLASP